VGGPGTHLRITGSRSRSRARRGFVFRELSGTHLLARRTTAPAAEPAAPPPFPTREQILAFVAESKERVGKREIAKAFGITGAAKIDLKRVLKEIEADGALDRSRGGLAPAGHLPPVVLADIRSRDRHGDFLAVPAEWTGTGKPPSIVLTQGRGPRKGNRPAPGIGDRALIRVERDAEGGYTGRVIKVIGKNKAEIIGVYREGARDPDPAR
jgi:ribonuclease R